MIVIIDKYFIMLNIFVILAKEKITFVMEDVGIIVIMKYNFYMNKIVNIFQIIIQFILNLEEFITFLKLFY